jgi:hypothetical protein
MPGDVEKKLSKTLPLHAAAGGCLGLILLLGLAGLDTGPFKAAVSTETFAILCVAFISYFAVGSGLTGFLLVVTE